MVLMRLRLGLWEQDLTSRFDIAQSTVVKDYIEMDQCYGTKIRLSYLMA